MSFQLAKYIEPDFTKKIFVNAPNARLIKAPCAKAAPKGFHATSIFPEYFKIDGKAFGGGQQNGRGSGLGRRKNQGC